MKKYLVGVCALVCLAGCQKVELADVENVDVSAEQMRDVQFVLKGLNVDYTRATLASEGMTDLWVYEGETLLKHQVSTDSDFGAPTVALSIGAHDLTFVASKATGQSFSGHWQCTKVADTFGAVVEYTVTSSSKSKQVQLSRLNGRVGWTIEDAIPEGAKTMTLKITDQCYGLDAELNGVDAAQYVVDADVSSRVGKTGFAPGVMVLPANHAEGSDVVAYVKVTDESANALCEYVHTVTVRANEEVKIHGAFFSGSAPAAVTLNAEWGQVTSVDVK